MLVAKNLGEDEERHGSVTLLIEQYFGVQNPKIQPGVKYTQWITFFDHPDDDIYDGILNEDDEEVPRIKLEFSVEDVGENRASQPSRPPTS